MRDEQLLVWGNATMWRRKEKMRNNKKKLREDFPYYRYVYRGIWLIKCRFCKKLTFDPVCKQS